MDYIKLTKKVNRNDSLTCTVNITQSSLIFPEKNNKKATQGLLLLILLAVANCVAYKGIGVRHGVPNLY